MKKKYYIFSLLLVFLMLVLASCKKDKVITSVDIPIADTTTYFYTGNEIEYKIKESDLYSVSNNKKTNAGTYEVIVRLNDKDNYKWSDDKTTDIVYSFVINPKIINKPAVTEKIYSYTGSEITFEIPESSYYKVSDNKKTDVGSYEATVSLKDKTNYVWNDNTTTDLKYSFSIINNNVTFAEITDVLESYTYTGENITPTPSVKLGDDVLTLNDDYTLSYDNNLNAGTASITITGTGSYTGTKTITFEISKANPTVTAPKAVESLVYDGNELTLITAGTTTAGTIQYKLEDGEYSTTLPKATNARTYKVYYKVVGNDNYNDVEESSIDVTIAKATSSITTTPTAKTNLVYTGSELTLITAGEATGGTLVYSLDNDSYSIDLPIGVNAGTYTIYYKVLDNDNYSGTEASSIEVTVSKANPTVTAPTAKTLTYSTKEQVLIEEATTTGGTIKYSLNNTNYSTELPKGTNAGNYKVYYKVEGNDNFNDKDAQSIDVTISKASPTVTAPTPIENLKWTGDELTLITAGEATGGTLKYSLDENDNYSTDLPKATNEGTYKVYYKVVGNDNYNDVDTQYVEAIIVKDKIVPTVTAPTAKDSLIYTGSAQELINAGSTNGGTLVYSLNENADFSADLPKSTNAGSYKVYYKVIEDSEYSGTIAKSIEVTIEKADSQVTAPTAYTNIVYNKNKQTLIIAGSSTTGTIKYRLEDGDYGTELPKGTNAGTYKVYYKVVGDDNHKDTVEASITVTISKANPVITGIEANTLTYNGEAQELITEGSTSGGTLKYSLVEDGDYSTTIPTGTNVNTYKVYYKVVGNDNYNDIDAQFVEVTITALSIDSSSIIVSTITDQIYTGSEIKPELTITLNNNVLVKDTDYTLAYANNVDAGTATITITGINNFTGTKDATFKIVTDTHTYTVTFDADGGTAVINIYYNATDNLVDIDLPTTSKLGYTFLGWKGISGDTVYTSIPAGTNSNLDLTAVYEVITYTITYTLNGGSVASANPLTYTVEDEITLNNPTLDYYTFTGWTGSNGNTPNKNVIIALGSTGNKNYVANYSPTNYTITYVLNGGSVSPSNPTSYNIVSDDFTLNNPTKKGYTFLGWTSEDITDSTTSVTVSKGSHGDITFTANWSVINYDITYTLAGGSTASANPATYTVEDTFTLINPTKAGYTFLGWTGSNGSIPQTSVTIAKGTIGELNYTANWETTNYTIHYNLMGGTNNTNNPASYTMFDEDITLAAPTRLGYTFTGWTGSNGDTPQVSVTITNGSSGEKSYTANWAQETYNLTYNLAGGTLASSNPATYNSTTDTFTLNNPTRNGYTFAGWTGTGLDSATTEVSVTYGSTGDRSYTATWDLITYTITFDVNGGTGTVDNIEYTIETDTFNLPTNVTKTGYTFDWYNNTTSISTITKGNYYTNLNLVAHWTPVNYTISYDLNGGSVSSANLTNYNIETSTFTLTNPTKNGYTFDGWTGTDLSDETLSVTISKGSMGNRSYTANWSIATYSISYNLDGGSVATPNPTEFTIETPTFTLTNPTKTGYTFLGWTGYNGTTPQETISIGLGSYENRTYTANWQLTTYTVTYTLNGGDNNSNNPTSFNITTPSFTLGRPSKTGYTFVNWTLNDTEITSIDPSSHLDDITIVANFIECPYIWNSSFANGTFGAYEGNTKLATTSAGEGKLTLANSYIGQEITFKASTTTVNYAFDGIYKTQSETTTLATTNPSFTFDTTIPYEANRITLTPEWYSYNITVSEVFADDPTSPFSGGPNYTKTGDLITGATIIYTITIPSNLVWDGWYKESELQNSRNVILELELSKTAQSYTAKWYQLSSVLTVVTSGDIGSTAIELSDNLTMGSTATLTATNVENYAFVGWFSDDTYNTSIGNEATLEITLSTTLQTIYAKYVKDSIAISRYYMNLANVATNVDDENHYGGYVLSKVIGASNTTVTFTSYTGFELTEVRLHTNQSTTYLITNNSVELPNSDDTIYYEAIWTPISYTITYELDEGTNDSSNPSSYTIISDTFTLKAPTKAESTFLGWTGTDLSEETLSVTISKGSTGNRTYTANWGGANVKVKLYENNGVLYNSNNYNEIEEPSGTSLPTPTRDGYTFGGWYNDPYLTGSQITKISSTYTSLYAYWEEETLSYYFDFDGTTCIDGFNTNYTAPTTIVFPSYYSGNEITTINMNVNWGSSYSLPSTIDSIKFGYYQNGTDSEVEEDYYNDDSLFNRIDSEYDYYQYKNKIYLINGDGVYLCSEIEWKIIEQNGIYTLLCNEILDACLFDDLNDKIDEIVNTFLLLTGKNIDCNLPESIDIIIETTYLTEYVENLGLDEERYFLVDAPMFDDFSYYYNGLEEDINDHATLYGIRPVITVTF